MCNEWMDIESAPKDGTLFLCWVSAVRYGETDEGQQYQQDASQVDFCSWRDGPSDLPGHGYFDPCCGQIADSQDVTHWMPLPAAPGASPPAAVPTDGLRTAARLACEATADQLPMALDALRDHLAASPPAALAVPADPLRKALKFIDKHTADVLRTNSKDSGDWAEDMAYVGKVARDALAASPHPPAPADTQAQGPNAALTGAEGVRVEGTVRGSE